MKVEASVDVAVVVEERRARAARRSGLVRCMVAMAVWSVVVVVVCWGWGARGQETDAREEHESCVGVQSTL